MRLLHNRSLASIVRRGVPLLFIPALLGQPTWAQEYPNRPVRFLTMSSPGGDILVRLMAEEVSKNIGQTVFVENKLGGAGLVGAAAGATATPDGYTVLFALGSTMTITTNLVAKVPFDTLHDVTPLALVASNPLVLLVNPTATPIGTAQELVAGGREKPGSITYSTYGTGSMPHILTSLFAKKNQVQMTAIAYRTNTEAYADLLAGRLTIMLDQVTNALPYIEAKKVRALAVTGGKRHGRLLDVPTMIELGLMDFEGLNWTGVYVPANTPPDIVQRLVSELERARASQVVSHKIEALGADVGRVSGPSFAAFHAEEFHRWGKAVRELGLHEQ
jgi:tripartite-type tricarboxylate transporter receptor subunit TctC